jgi:PmbA protein
MMDTGFLVTDLLGHGTNMVTGDYSRGASGFWVENGEIVHPVQEVTVAGNLKDMFKAIRGVGNDHLNRSSFKVGSLLIDSMTVGGD